MSILETHLCTLSSLTETYFKRRTVKCQAEVVQRASSLPWMPGDPRRDNISLEREFLAESLLSTGLKFLDFKMRWHLLNPIMYSYGPNCFQANRTIALSKEARNQIWKGHLVAHHSKELAQSQQGANVRRQSEKREAECELWDNSEVPEWNISSESQISKSDFKSWPGESWCLTVASPCNAYSVHTLVIKSLNLYKPSAGSWLKNRICRVPLEQPKLVPSMLDRTRAPS